MPLFVRVTAHNAGAPTGKDDGLEDLRRTLVGEGFKLRLDDGLDTDLQQYIVSFLLVNELAKTD